MTNEEKIISMLENIQKDIDLIKISIEEPDAEKVKAKQRKDLFKALEDFARVDTPEEQAELDAFFAFMDAQEERKRAKYALLS